MKCATGWCKKDATTEGLCRFCWARVWQIEPERLPMAERLRAMGGDFAPAPAKAAQS